MVKSGQPHIVSESKLGCKVFSTLTHPHRLEAYPRTRSRQHGKLKLHIINHIHFKLHSLSHSSSAVNGAGELTNYDDRSEEDHFELQHPAFLQGSKVKKKNK